MKYFVCVTQDHWSAKNGLHADIRKIAREQHGTLIHGDENRSRWLTHMRASIKDAHDANRTCKAMEMQHWFPEKKDTMHVYVSNVFEIRLYPITGEFTTDSFGFTTIKKGGVA